MGLFGVRTLQADRMARAKALWQAGLCGVQGTQRKQMGVERLLMRVRGRGCTTLATCCFLYLTPSTGLTLMAVSCSHLCS